MAAAPVVSVPNEIRCAHCQRVLFTVTDGPGVVVEPVSLDEALPRDVCALCPPPCRRWTCVRVREVLRAAA